MNRKRAKASASSQAPPSIKAKLRATVTKTTTTTVTVGKRRTQRSPFFDTLKTEAKRKSTAEAKNESPGLIQESLNESLYALCIQAILWNQTRGQQARPVLEQILTTYPTPAALAAADLSALTTMLQPIGLHNQRALRLIALGKAWVESPPCKERRYRKLDYPVKGVSGRDVRPNEILEENDDREGWEVAHLPGMGPYALDSYRIFFRDKLRGTEEETVEKGTEEWRRVVPLDKDLRRYLVWRWRQDGWDWDMFTGKKHKIGESAR